MNYNSFDSSIFSSANAFDSIKISLISPEKVYEISHGEVTKPETINYRTFKAERDGLFCPRIFGPVNSNECMCGKYKRNTKYRGIVCEKCGVEVTDSFVRRSRVGHIALASPVVHIWFLKSMPSRIGILLDMQLRSIEMILYNNLYVVIEPGKTIYKRYELLEESDYTNASEENAAEGFIAMTGAEAIHRMLADLDLESLAAELSEELPEITSEMKRKKVIRRLRLVQHFIASKNRPEWMVVSVIPVLPPDLRPLVMLEAGRFASSDLNDLYRMVINRNNRLKKLLALSAPEIIIRNEKRMLQEAVDSFFDNSRRGKSAKSTGKNKRLLKSLSDGLKGKQGRFRQNLLGKRVDYSGRSVIVVGPQLKLHQCGLPKKMAIELFKPYLYRLIELYGIVSTLRSAKRFVECEDRPEINDLLQEIIKNHPVLLNRAPTLHRLGIQAFEIVLIEGKAIQLHPLVCTAFNADFDGDQMAVHVPLSIEAQLECYVLMLSTHNLLSPSSGKPIVMPSKDIVMGLYYITLMEDDDQDSDMRTYDDAKEVTYALHEKIVTYHTKIYFILTSTEESEDGDTGSGNLVRQKILTTAGRIILFDHFGGRIPFKFFNTLLNNKALSEMVSYVYKRFSRRNSAEIIDEIKQLGYKYATLSGISVGKNDMVIPSSKGMHIEHSYKDVDKLEQQFEDGLITADERRNKVISVWLKCTDDVFNDMIKGISSNINVDGSIRGVEKLNSVFMMSSSGARGSPAQLKQLAGMRGLMSKPSGEIIERPILSNFREGLSVFEYFNATHGARKGLSDTALKTANSGYLTRRLVDVAQDCIISHEDCGTRNGVTISSLIEGVEALSEFKDAIVGRIITDDLINPVDGSIVLSAGSMVDEDNVEIVSTLFESVKVRSPITCDIENNICVKCYGRDLATGYIASIGDAVGVIAAQSIGEPGTQLTMRTFHVGGAASGSVEKASIDANVDAYIQLNNEVSIVSADGSRVVMNRICEVILYDDHKKMRARHKIPYGSILHVVSGDKVSKCQTIASWDPYSSPIISEIRGIIRYQDLENGISYDEIVDELTGVSNKIITDWRQRLRGASLRPALLICDPEDHSRILKLPNGLDAIYLLPIGTSIKVSSNDEIQIGSVLAATPKEISRARDITGGLPRVIELFEARTPRDAGIIAAISGTVEFNKDYKIKKRVLIRSHDDPENHFIEFFVHKNQFLTVNEGDTVNKGDLIVDGPLDPHEILKVNGIDGIANFFVNEIQKVYRMQGAPINNKHIEIILKQMIGKVEIIDPGETLYLRGEQFTASQYRKIIAQCNEQCLSKPTVINLLQGITRSSLESDSYISAASFQETVKVLIDAAIAGKKDDLHGLKENIIVGRLIPAGTGYFTQKIKANILSSMNESESLINQPELNFDVAAIPNVVSNDNII